MRTCKPALTGTARVKMQHPSLVRSAITTSPALPVAVRQRADIVTGRRTDWRIRTWLSLNATSQGIYCPFPASTISQLSYENPDPAGGNRLEKTGRRAGSRSRAVAFSMHVRTPEMQGAPILAPAKAGARIGPIGGTMMGVLAYHRRLPLRPCTCRSGVEARCGRHRKRARQTG